MRSVELLQGVGVDAYWSGCLTLMIGQSYAPAPPEKRRGIYIIDVRPDVEDRWVPKEISARATRWSNEFDPLIMERTGRRFAEIHQRMRLLAHAELVITRRLHVALPCAGFRTPVLTLPDPGISDARHRFSGYESFLPIVWPDASYADFDFGAPTRCDIPAALLTEYARLCTHLGHAPERMDWDADFSADFTAGDECAAARSLGLSLPGDVEVWPDSRDAAGRRAIRVSGFPFAHKLAGEVVAVPVGPRDGVAALDDYPVRRVVGLISAQLSVETDVARLDWRMRELAQGELFPSVMAFWLPTLREARYRDLETDWRRAAVAFGVDAYETGRLVDIVWRTGDVNAAKRAIADMRHALTEQTFSAHGDAFHRGKNIEILDGFDALIRLDEGDLTLGDTRLDALHPYVLSAVYDVMCDAHAAGESERARRMALLYIRATSLLGHGPETALWIGAHILQPLGAYGDLLRVLDALPMAEATVSHQWRYQALTAAAAIEQGDDARYAASIGVLDALFETLLVEEMLGDAAWCDAYVFAVTRRGAWTAERQRLHDHAHDVRARVLAGRLAIEAIEGVSEGAAESLARLGAVEPADVLTESGLGAVDVLAGIGDWQAAARLYGAGNAALLNMSRRSADVSQRALPEEGWVWSGRGIGDDILRLKMLVGLKSRDLPYRYDIDARLAPLAQRALPAMQFQSTPRAVGPGAVGRDQFWRARNGVPRTFDAFRVTRDRLDWLQRGESVLQGEEIFLSYLRSNGVVTQDASPILAASDGAMIRARQLIPQREDGRLTLALAWRSGVMNASRRRYFIDLEELEPLWSLQDIRWLVVQHDLSAHEKSIIERTPTLISLPEIDMRNDFDALVALFGLVDGVVAPKLSTRDMAAAAGARVLSMSFGGAHIEGARLQSDGVTDRVFPNIRHVCQSDVRDRAEVVRETARRVRDWIPVTPAA